MRPVHGEGGLAEAGGTVDPRDDDGTPAGLVEQRVQRVDLAGPTGEVAGGGRQLSRYHRGGGGPAGAPRVGDPVPRGGQRALFGRARAEQPDQRVEPLGRRQDLPREVVRDGPVRPAGLGGQFADRQLRSAPVACLPPA